VIPNDVYQQVHLGLNKIVKKKSADGEKAEGAAGAPAVTGLPNLPFAIPPAAK
jgi:hypothetical protein